MNKAPLIPHDRLEEYLEWVDKYTKIVRQEEREACAKICDFYYDLKATDAWFCAGLLDAAEDIRKGIYK